MKYAHILIDGILRLVSKKAAKSSYLGLPSQSLGPVYIWLTEHFKNLLPSKFVSSSCTWAYQSKDCSSEIYLIPFYQLDPTWTQKVYVEVDEALKELGMQLKI